MHRGGWLMNNSWEEINMRNEIISVISGIVWGAIKDGVKVTYNVLRKIFGEKGVDFFSKEEYEKIVKIANDIPDIYKQNELLIEGYLQTNKELLDILKKERKSDIMSVTQYSWGSGDNVGRDKIVKG